jgi:CDP-diacylglycerol--inositol 3-phosphatidyltransferase
MNTKVLLYIPNIIGYLRIILLFTAIFFSDAIFTVLYCISISLDYFDGKAARYFGQVSKLGACLDIITDRISTTLICIKIVQKKPSYQKECLVYIFLDILSHFIFFVGAIYQKGHHKSFCDNFLLRIYYNDTFLKIMCLGSELYFIMLHALSKTSFFVFLLRTIAYLKTFFHIMHLVLGMCILSDIPNAEKDS